MLSAVRAADLGVEWVLGPGLLSSRSRIRQQDLWGLDSSLDSNDSVAKTDASLRRGLTEDPARHIQPNDLFEKPLNGTVRHVAAALHEGHDSGQVRCQQAAGANLIGHRSDLIAKYNQNRKASA